MTNALLWTQEMNEISQAHCLESFTYCQQYAQSLDNKLFCILTALQSFNYMSQPCHETLQRGRVLHFITKYSPTICTNQFVYCHTRCPHQRKADLPQKTSQYRRKDFVMCMQEKAMKKLHVINHTHAITYNLVCYSFPLISQFCVSIK